MESAASNGTVVESPTCHKCGGAMTRRTSAKSKRDFWGCNRYPVCDGLIDIQPDGVTEPDDSIAASMAWRWRRDAAKEVLLAIVGNWHNMPAGTDAAVLAVKLTDDLLVELRGRGES